MPSKRRLLPIFGLLAFTAAIPATAGAKGPCPRCIEPSTARVDSKLRVAFPTARAVWNPPARLLPNGPEGSHVEGSPSVVVYDGIRQPGFVFRAPNVDPGRYLVVLFEDPDRRAHYTWDFVTVESGLPDEAPTEGMPGWAIALAIAAGVLIAP